MSDNELHVNMVVIYTFCYWCLYYDIDCKIVVIQLLIFAAMTVFNKPLVEMINEMK